MRRYIFPFEYKGDPTVGWTTPSLPAGLDKSELVQPSSGALYPPAPADHVLVGLGCNALDAAECSAVEPADFDALALLRAELVPLMDAAAAELVADGFVEVARVDNF